MKKIYIPMCAAVIAAAFAGCQAKTDASVKSGSEAVSVVSESVVEPVSDDGGEDSLVFGTATLTYAEFYSGDVSSTEHYDAVSSATTSKYQILDHMETDFVDEETNADGYHITGVKNVTVAVSEKDLAAYKEANSSFVQTDAEEPKQYKKVTMEGDKPVYSETEFNVADTVTDAQAELLTGTNWGDYQINVTDGETIHLRNAREGEFDIGSNIQGIILETDDGLKVGMEALQSIWVQPYEVSFNVEGDNSHNTHIAAYDNLAELSKLVGKTVNRITYITPESTYVYEFEGIYIKPIFEGEISSKLDGDTVVLSTSDFSEFENVKAVVTYTVGSGHDTQNYVIAEFVPEDGNDIYAVDTSEIAQLEDKTGVYSAVITSDNLADVAVSVPASAEQRDALRAVVDEAKEKLAAEGEDDMLTEHIGEAKEMLEDETASSKDMGSLLNELKRMIAPQEEKQGGNH